MGAPSLKGIRVIDASRILAGPYCGQLLADNGADVIKIESHEGDANRSWDPVVNGIGTNYMSANRGKRVVAINLKTEAGQGLLHRLVGEADVFLHNFLPRVANSLRVDYETLSRINPSLIYAGVSGYGAKGPMADRAGYDTMVTGFCGIMSITGEADGPSVRVGVPMLDLTTGILAYSGIISALFARATGKARGQKVDVSLLETGVSLLGFRGLNWLVAGEPQHREGSGFSWVAPYGAYRCQNGSLLMGVPTEAHWKKLCDILDDKDLCTDPKLATNRERVRHNKELTAAIEAILMTQPVAYWDERMGKAGLVSGPINDMEQVFASEQVRANDMVVDVKDDSGNVIPLLGLPFKLSDSAGTVGRAPRAIGQDTDEVLTEILKVSASELSDLRRNGAI